MKNLKLFMFTLVAFLVVGFAVNVKAEGNVAKIEETEYATVEAAIDAAEDGQTIVLLQDVEETPTIDGKDIILDLGEYTLTVDGWGLDVYDSTLTVKNGTINSTGDVGVYLNNANTFTLDSTAKIIGKGSGVISDLYPSDATETNSLTINGEINVTDIAISLSNESALVVNAGAKVIGEDGILIASAALSSDVTINGYIEGSNVGITINGNITDASAAPIINIGKTAEIVTDGEETVGLYLAGYGKTTIAEGAKISGTADAVEIRAGELTINGGTFTSSYDGEAVVVTSNGNGSTTVGAALAIAQHTTKSPISVTINGGTFNGVAAIYESNPESNSAEHIAKVSASIIGGTFNGTSDDAVFSEDVTGFITGGTYNKALDAKYVADNYSAYKSSDEYVVEPTIEKITLDKTETTLAIGKTLTLKPSVTPSASTTGYTYTSSNTKVATVDSNGKITAVANGTATITVKSTYDTSKTATIKITVKTDITKAKVTGIVNKTYDKKAQKQSVTVKLNGKTLKDKTDYNVSYKNNTKIGTATLTITGKGNYTGTITKTFKINPVKIAIKKLTGKKKALKVSYYVPAGNVTYQIKYKKMGTTDWKTINTSKTSYTIKKLKAHKKYQVKVRAVKKVNGVTYYGAWSSSKKVRVK